MRTLLACLIAVCGCAADVTATQPSAAAQKLVDDSISVVSKARHSYDQAAKKEQDKLSAALAKEQERETKKGNLDGALAIKALIDEVEMGLLTRQAGAAMDLLGEGTKPVAPGTVPANLLTDCLIASITARTEAAPTSIEQMMAKASMLAIPKGDKTRYNFSAASAGTIAILTGGSERNHTDIWADLQKAGFKRSDDGEDGVWFVLEAKAGARFVAYDPPLAGAQLQIFAGKIKQAR